MINKLRSIYNGNSLNGATAGIIYIPILEDCTLQRFDIRREGTITGEVVFAVKRNGSGIDDINQVIPAGENLAAFEDWNLELVRGDVITLDFISGAIDSFLTLNLEVNDGASSGGGSGLPQGDLNAETNEIEKIQGFPVNLAVDPTAFSDLFNSIEETNSKWIVLSGDDTAAPSETPQWTQSNGQIVQTNPTDGARRFVTIGEFSFRDGDTLTFNYEFGSQFGNKTTIGFGRNFVSGVPQNSLYFDIRPNGTMNSFVVENGSEFATNVNGAQGGTDSMKFTRYRRDGVNIILEKSPNNLDWTTLISYESPAAVSAPIRIFFGGTTGYEGLRFFDIVSTFLSEEIAQLKVLVKDANDVIKAITLAELKTALNALP